jgi:cytochrome c oxidase assembly protein Cox11
MKKKNQKTVRIAALLAVSSFALMPFAAQASIDNTVTASGTAPGGPVGGVTATTNENVDVADDAPLIQLVKTWVFAPGGDVDNDGQVDPGDTIRYVYTVTNTGNVTLEGVGVGDLHDGVGPALNILPPTTVTTDNGSAPAGTIGDSTDTNTTDALWDRLGPNDVITFLADYVVLPGDFTAPTSTDGDIDSTATATGTYQPGPTGQTVSSVSNLGVPLQLLPSLQIAKVADDDTEVTAGQVITYTYTVTNNGNVPISSVTLADTHNGVAGALTPAFQSFTTNTGSTNTGNTINVLQPGDVAVYTATYTVTQTDVDTRQ